MQLMPLGWANQLTTLGSQTNSSRMSDSAHDFGKPDHLQSEPLRRPDHLPIQAAEACSRHCMTYQVASSVLQVQLGHSTVLTLSGHRCDTSRQGSVTVGTARLQFRTNHTKAPRLTEGTHSVPGAYKIAPPRCCHHNQRLFTTIIHPTDTSYPRSTSPHYQDRYLWHVSGNTTLTKQVAEQPPQHHLHNTTSTIPPPQYHLHNTT